MINNEKHFLETFQYIIDNECFFCKQKMVYKTYIKYSDYNCYCENCKYTLRFNLPSFHYIFIIEPDIYHIVFSNVGNVFKARQYHNVKLINFVNPFAFNNIDDYIDHIKTMVILQ